MVVKKPVAKKKTGPDPVPLKVKVNPKHSKNLTDVEKGGEGPCVYDLIITKEDRKRLDEDKIKARKLDRFITKKQADLLMAKSHKEGRLTKTDNHKLQQYLNRNDPDLQVKDRPLARILIKAVLRQCKVTIADLYPNLVPKVISYNYQNPDNITEFAIKPMGQMFGDEKKGDKTKPTIKKMTKEEREKWRVQPFYFVKGLKSQPSRRSMNETKHRVVTTHRLTICPNTAKERELPEPKGIGETFHPTASGAKIIDQDSL